MEFSAVDSMTSKLDQSLGDIIDSSKASRGSHGSKRGGRGGSSARSSNDSKSDATGPVRRGRATRRDEPYLRESGPRTRGSDAQQQQKWGTSMFVPPIILPAHQPGANTHSTQTQRVVGDTIHISNLDKSVTSDDLTDIFKPVGTIKSVNLHYDQNGASIGTATITFQRKPDAAKAVDEFDGAEVDGRVMNIKLVGEVVTGPGVVKKGQAAVDALAQFPIVPPNMLQQFAQFHAQQAAELGLGSRQTSATGRSNRGEQSQPTRGSTRGRGAATKRGRGAAPSRGGRGGARGGRGSDKPVSADDLNAQLDSYHATKPKADASKSKSQD